MTSAMHFCLLRFFANRLTRGKSTDMRNQENHDFNISKGCPRNFETILNLVVLSIKKMATLLKISEAIVRIEYWIFTKFDVYRLVLSMRTEKNYVKVRELRDKLSCVPQFSTCNTLVSDIFYHGDRIA